MFRFTRNFDWLLVVAMLLLTTLGIVMISSTSLGEARNYDLAIRQAVFAVIGLGLFFLLGRSNPETWRSLSIFFYLGSVLLLIFVFAYGFQARGSLRWIDLGAFRFQPSELVKISTILLLANLFSSVNMRRVRNLLVSVVLVLIPTALIYLQPDLGSALVLLAIWVGMVLSTEVPKKYFLAGAAAVILFAPFAINFLQPYQKTRLFSFLNPGADPLGTGYNVIQSTIAVGSGGIFGLGYGRGTQSHLNFLPEHHTDFIFATLAEELGLVGSLLLLTLLGILAWRLLANLPRKTAFEGLILIGLFVLITFQAGINICMNIGLAPVTGVTLPFVSYGGSSLITLMAGLGIVESVIKRHPPMAIDDQVEVG